MRRLYKLQDVTLAKAGAGATGRQRKNDLLFAAPMFVPPVSADDSRGIDLVAVRDGQASLRRQGALSGVHWLFVVASFVITIAAWYTSHTAVREREQARFAQAADAVVETLQSRLQHYEDALRAGVATLQLNGGTLNREQWRLFTDHLDLAARYPGINGVGVIHHMAREEADVQLGLLRSSVVDADFSVFPEHSQDMLLPIVLVEPVATNAAAIGLDVAFERNRREAALAARDEGLSRISGPIELVQDDAPAPGFLFYMPFYRHDEMRPATEADVDYRRVMFGGFVYAPFIMRKLVAGALGASSLHVKATISDGDTVLHDQWADEGALREAAGHAVLREVEVYGRTWSFDVRSTPAFDSAAHLQPFVVLASGLTVDALLLGLLLLLSRSRARMQNIAERMTDELSEKAVALADSNEHLESFAHVLSHDLKTPIRGIQNLAEFLEEDLEDYLASNDANHEIKRNLERVNEQAERANALIKGIFDYSVVGENTAPATRVDCASLVKAIGDGLLLDEERLRIDGELPVLHTDAVRLEQVLVNLIGNALKYHLDPEAIRITVSSRRIGAFHEFSIADNGPGIEPRFHARIFEPFKTLKARSDVHGSGIGLSIVRRSVEAFGGTVRVESQPNHDGAAGATFHFQWPVCDGLSHATEAA